MTKIISKSYSAAVTGMGIVSSAGLNIEENWEKICSGISTATKDESLAGLTVDFSCRVNKFNPEKILGRSKTLRTARFIQLALTAAREAIDNAKLNPNTWDSSKIGLVIGNSLGGTEVLEKQFQEFDLNGENMISPLTVPAAMGNMVAGYLAMELNISGPSIMIGNACASGTTAIGFARELLRSEQCDIVVAGGTESALSPKIISALNNMNALSRESHNPAGACRPFDVTRNGFVAGEAAGILILETRKSLKKNKKIHAFVSGFGSSTDAYHPTAPHPEGRGIVLAMHKALHDSGLNPEQITHVNAHGTSTKLNDSIESDSIVRALGRDVIVTSTKGVTGHTLAAAGAIEAVYTILAIEKGLIPPTANLNQIDPSIEITLVKDQPLSKTFDNAMSLSLGFGGHNAALIFTDEAI